MGSSFGYGKGGKAFRYYVAGALQVGGSVPDHVVRRVSAPQLEALVLDRCLRLGVEQPMAPNSDLVRVQIESHAVILVLRPAGLKAGHPSDQAAFADGVRRLDGDDRLELAADGHWHVHLAVRPVFRGGRTWLVNPQGGSPFTAARPDPALVKALKRAHQVTRKHAISPTMPIEDLQGASSPADSYHRRLAKLAFLAPDIQAAILAGRQSPGLTLQRLLNEPLPAGWVEQRRLLI